MAKTVGVNVDKWIMFRPSGEGDRLAKVSVFREIYIIH